eukprot:Tbor_TRINITY_DN5872_c1_g1::TRINITY_DN5872_c1_g1_i1::g.7247::m.7247
MRNTPRQVRFSNECGIHVLRNALRVDMPEEVIKVKSLKYLRRPLEELSLFDCPELKKRIIMDMKGLEPFERITAGDNSIEETDTDEDEEESIDMEALLKEYPRTGETYWLEKMSIKEFKREIERKKTAKNKPWQGLSKGTEERHRSLLDKCQKWLLREDLQREEMAVDTFLIAGFLKEKIQKSWTSGTLQNYLASLSAALRLLPLYRQGSSSIFTGERYRAAVTSAKREANKEGAKTIVPEMSEKELKDIYKRMNTEEEKTFITIAWELAGRVSDILKLRIENTHEEKRGNEITFSFKFVEGKTASRENYILSSKVTKAPVLRYLRKQLAKKKGMLFSLTKAEIAEKLKPLRLECRSIRKGRLISLAREGMPVAEIMKISRHKLEGTLFRYIGFSSSDIKNWGKKRVTVRGGREEGPPSTIPRWTRFEDCPSHEDLQKAFPRETKNWQRKVWPVKIKKIEPANIEKLNKLDCLDKACGEFNKKQLKWLSEKSLYIEDKEAKKKIRKTSFSKEEENEMEGYKWESTQEDPTGGVYGFKIAEPNKERARPVWSCEVNCRLDSFDSFRSSSKDEIYEMMDKNSWFIEFDVKAMYDHFVLEESVRNFFQFVPRGSTRGRLRLLPMGFGPSAVVAQSTTYKLLNFKKTSTIASCIDNMGIANSSKENLIEDAIKLVDRAAEAKFTLNDLPKPEDWRRLDREEKREMVNKKITNEFEFLGVNYDLKKKERRNTRKTVEKIKTLVNILRKRENMTKRGVASVIGVYRYASEVIDYDMTRRFEELRQLRVIIGEGVTNIDEWDKICKNVNYEGLIEWGEELIPNTPVKIRQEGKVGEKTILITDASAEGWGAIMIRREIIKERHGEWKDRIRHSSEAEPKAIEMALEAFKEEVSERVMILTDHENLVHAM